jgi:hypothetical protein
MRLKPMRLSTKYKVGLVLLACVGLGVWFGRSLEAEREKAREQHREYCLDHLCEGDVVPKYDPVKEFAFKLNGQWFIGPREYGGYGGSLAFFWPSKTPRNKIHAERDAPEFVPSAAGRSSNFYDVAIEIFLRSHDGVMHGPSRYKALQLAETEGRVISKNTPRPGLEVWRVRDKSELRPFIWYVATNYREEDGEPPVLGCDDRNPKFDRCNTAFIWKPGIAADMRFRAWHGVDWPEIYQETMRVLQLLKRA